MTVVPATTKLMATPDTIWLPRLVIEAKPCTSAKKTATSDGGAEAEPGGAGDGCDAGAGEGAGQHLAFKSDVENAGALGIEAGEAGKQQRHRHADRRVRDRQQCAERIPSQRL